MAQRSQESLPTPGRGQCRTRAWRANKTSKAREASTHEVNKDSKASKEKTSLWQLKHQARQKPWRSMIQNKECASKGWQRSNEGSEAKNEERQVHKTSKTSKHNRWAKLAKDLSPCDREHGLPRSSWARGPNLESECTSTWRAKEHGDPR